MVCAADKNRRRREAGRDGSQDGSQETLWGVFCYLSRTALAQAAADVCSYKKSLSRVCIYHIRGSRGFIFCLKKLPAMAKMMADEEYFFLSLDPEEAAFLQKMMNEQHVIGLSYLETDGEGKIIQVSGPLSSCVSRIVRCRFGKRYAIVRLHLLGKEKEVLLGIILKEDICREIRYGKVEAPVNIPEKYERMNLEGTKKKGHCPEYSVGDVVQVADGAFAGCREPCFVCMTV